MPTRLFSSVGQSSGLLSRWSQVQILEGPQTKINTMALNFETRTTHHYVLDNMMVSGSGHRGDDIGATLDAYIAYGDERFLDGITQCWKKVKDTYSPDGYHYQGYRYPGYQVNDLSRDHTSYTLIALKLAGRNKGLKDLVTHLQWRISDKYSFTIDMWLWSRALIGSKLAEFFFYLITVPIMFFAMLWNVVLYRVGKFGGEVPQSSFIKRTPAEIPTRQLKVRKLLYPAYALHNLSWQLYVLRDCWVKNMIKVMLRPMVGSENFVIQALLNMEVDELGAYLYKPMRGGRWTTRLDNTNDRNLKVIEDPKLIEFNQLDRDYMWQVIRNF